MKTYALPAYLQRFFTERLAAQLKASPNTVTSYRDTFRLLLRYAADRFRRPPTEMLVAGIDAELIGLFLADIESTRSNSARSRNTRLSVIRSFFKYVAVNEPQLLHHCQRILAMPAKGHEKRRSTICRAPRSRPSLGCRISPRGTGVAIGPYWRSRSRPDCGSPS
jgi:integrase/recombinase XerD